MNLKCAGVIFESSLREASAGARLITPEFVEEVGRHKKEGEGGGDFVKKKKLSGLKISPHRRVKKKFLKMQPAWKRGGGREDHGVKDFSRIGVRSSTEAAVPPTAACHLWEKGPGTSEAGRWGGGEAGVLVSETHKDLHRS